MTSEKILRLIKDGFTYYGGGIYEPNVNKVIQQAQDKGYTIIKKYRVETDVKGVKCYDIYTK